MLGSRKFLIFGFVSALVLSLLLVGAFAAEPEDVKSLGGGGASKVAPADFQIPAGKPFSTTTYIGSASGDNSTRGTDLESVYGESNPVYVTYISVQCQNLSGVWQSAYTASFVEPVPVYFKDTNSWLYCYVDGARVDNGWYSQGRVRCVFQNSVNELDSVSSKFPLNEIAPTFNMGALFSSFLGIGSQLIAFVIARPIVLIPLVVMLGIFAISVVRRFTKGV